MSAPSQVVHSAALSRRLVELHGVRISVESALGRGSRIFTLPIEGQSRNGR